MDTTTLTAQDFTTEAEAIEYMTTRFAEGGDGPAEIANYVTALKADMVENEADPSDWWKDINGDDLAEWLFRIF